MSTWWRRVGIAGAAIVVAGLLGGCAAKGSEPPKADVIGELQKLNLPTLPKTFTPEQKADIERAWNTPGQFFLKHGCFSCHSVSVYGIKGLSPVGPDLANAEADVEARFGRKLDDFLNEPQGTMQMVLGQLIKLTPEEKAEALKQLHAAYQAFEQQKAGSSR